MNRLIDYNATSEEIAAVFGSEESYQLSLEIYDENPGCDSEKFEIAALLSHRGEREESLKIIKSIKDDKYRISCLRDWDSWGAPAFSVVN